MDYRKTNKNFIYNLSYELLIVLTPLIVTPYISRVLGAELIGVKSYTHAILTYFLLFSNLGVAFYGQREIAKSYHDKDRRSIVFFSILEIKIVSFIIVLTVYCLIFFGFGVLSKYKIYFAVWIIQIIESVVNVTWFFQGAEKFKYIAIRGIIIRSLQILVTLSFIKSKSDFTLYLFFFTGFPLFQALVLWPFLRNEINWKLIRDANPFVHIKNVLVFFVPTIATTIYSSVDKVMLGGMLDSITQTGYYESAQRIALLSTTIFTSVYSVMRSRISAEKSGDPDVLNNSISYFIKVAICIILPVVFGVLAVTDNFVLVFFGSEYHPVIKMLRLFAFVIFFMGFSGMISAIYIVPFDKQKHLSVFYCFATILNLIINFLLIPRFAAVGAIVGSIVAEASVFVGCIVLARKVIKPSSIIMAGWKYLISSMIMFGYVYALDRFLRIGLWPLLFEILSGAALYFVLLVIMKDSLIKDLKHGFKKL